MSLGARNEANLRARILQPDFPAEKGLEDFRGDESSVPRGSFDYLASIEWLRARKSVCLLGPAGTAKSHLLRSAAPPSRPVTACATSRPPISSITRTAASPPTPRHA